MQGGPSQVDTFDPKPLLNKLHGQHPRRASASEVSRTRSSRKSPILGSQRTSRSTASPASKSRICFRNVAARRRSRRDPFLLPRRLHALAGAVLDQQRLAAPRPAEPGLVDSLRTRHRKPELPGFVVLLEGGIRSGPRFTAPGFLPAAYQGTSLRAGPESDSESEAARPACSRGAARSARHAADVNERHLDREPTIRSWRRASHPTNWRSACRWRRRSDRYPKETEATKKLYGLDEARTADFGGRCLLARRLVERGVRFVQVWTGEA